MAAPIPHYCFDYPNSEFCISTDVPNESVETSNLFNMSSNMLPFLNYDINSPVSVASFPDHHQPPPLPFGDFMVVPQMPEIETGFRDFSVCDYSQRQQQQVFDSGEECSGSVWPPYNNYPLLAENWGIGGGQLGAAVKGDESDDQVKVGRYSSEERKDRILRYLKKRNQRNFNKTIKYACRKTLADKRVRVRGRFAKNNDHQSSQHQMLINATHNQQNITNSFHHDSTFQMTKYEEEYWLQAAAAAAAMDNLGHFPYLGS